MLMLAKGQVHLRSSNFMICLIGQKVQNIVMGACCCIQSKGQEKYKQDPRPVKETSSAPTEVLDQRKRLINHNHKLTKRIEQAKQQNHNLDIQKEKIGMKLKQQQQYIQSKNASISSLKNQQAQLRIQLVTIQLVQLDNKITSTSAQIRNVSAQTQSIVGQTEHKAQKIKKYLQQIQQVQANIQKLKNDQSLINLQIDSFKICTQAITSEIKSIQLRRQEHQKQMQKIQSQISEISSLANKLTSKPVQRPTADTSGDRFTQLFPGIILEGEDDYKEYLTDVLQRRTQLKIMGTRLIYRFDSLNKVNFHKYIDQNTQIVVIVKLVNGYTLGGWSEGSFQPKMVSDKDGLIFSLTNRKSFQPLERNRRAITYDDYFLIFGNSQFRLKSQDLKVFSNFGISNGYYNTRGQKVDILLGSQAVRQVQMEALEVYKLVFK